MRMYILLSASFVAIMLLQTSWAADCPVKSTKCNSTQRVSCLKREGNCQCTCIKRGEACKTPWWWGYCYWYQRIACDVTDDACICRCGA
uniref:Putative metastriate ixostatin family member n=1 Tax=Rhipicephalus pulchellus TaxID=72859 RepID=L7M997_RHIPC